jgi:hypothetical protein
VESVVIVALVNVTVVDVQVEVVIVEEAVAVKVLCKLEQMRSFATFKKAKTHDVEGVTVTTTTVERYEEQSDRAITGLDVL